MIRIRNTQLPGGLLLGLLVLGADLSAQRPFAHNRLEFSNRLLTDRDDVFPNQPTATGTRSGDALFKVLPAEILGRHEDHRVSGYRLAIALQKAYAAFLPARVKVPSMQLYRTEVKRLGSPVLGFKDYDVVNLALPVTGTFDSFNVDLPTKGAYIIQVEMDPTSTDPKLQKLVPVPARVGGKRAALAIVLRGIAGESSQSQFRPTAVLRPSYLERHIGPGRDSYSGSYEKASDTIRMYGMLNQPSPRGEIYASLLFDNPTLTLYGTSAGGQQSQAAETMMGPGVFDSDLATGQKVARVGFFAQAQQFHSSPGTHDIIPMIVSLDAAGPFLSQQLGATMIRIDPNSSRLPVMFNLGYWGRLSTYTAGGVAGFVSDKSGAWASSEITVRPSSVMLGQVAWLQGVVIQVGGTFVDTTNVVRLTFN